MFFVFFFFRSIWFIKRFQNYACSFLLVYILLKLHHLLSKSASGNLLSPQGNIHTKTCVYQHLQRGHPKWFRLSVTSASLGFGTPKHHQEFQQVRLRTAKVKVFSEGRPPQLKNGCYMSYRWRIMLIEKGTLQGTNKSPTKAHLKMIFLFLRWDMLIPWRVLVIHSFCYASGWKSENTGQNPVSLDTMIMRYAGLLFAIPGPNFVSSAYNFNAIFVGFPPFDQFQIQQTGHMFFLPSWELTYPIPNVLLKMVFLFSQGGIC